MCGITGILDGRVTLSALKASVSALRHRGPDGSGVYLDPVIGLGLAHSRLAIIGPENGAQPLLSLDQQVVLVCSGEIYDFERQRRDLERGGCRFQTNSDSEVIIHLYQKHSLRFTDHLRGEFAFLLFDRTRRRLISVRDRFGIKPLYVCRTNRGGWVFSSEVKGIFATGLVAAEIDPMGPLSASELATPFHAVEHIAPATVTLIDVDSGKHESSAYWKPNFPSVGREKSKRRALSEHVEQTEHLLSEAIRVRMRADAPIGVYLSGGLDSSIVSAKVAALSQTTPHAFTVAFTGQGEQYNERLQARLIARHLGLEHHVLEVGTRQLWENLERCLWHVEAPFGNLAPIGKYLLSRLAQAHVKVVLTGEGADEVFLGYEVFRRALTPTGKASLWVNQRWKNLKEGLFSRVLRGRLTPGSCPLSESQADDPSQLVGRHPVVRLQYRRLKRHLMPTILAAYGDRTEMAHSIEGRTPFLDHHLFEGVREIPVEINLHQGVGKCPLRRVAKGIIPSEIAQRPKWPFSTPRWTIAANSNPSASRLMSKYLSRGNVERAGLFDWHGVALLRSLRTVRGLSGIVDSATLYLCSMQILQRLFVQGSALEGVTEPSDPLRTHSPVEHNVRRRHVSAPFVEVLYYE